MGSIRRSAGAALRQVQGFGLYRRVVSLMAGRHVTICEATDVDKLAVQMWLNPEGNPPQALHRNPFVTDLVAHCLGCLAGFVQLVRHPPEHAPYVGYWLFSLYVKPLFKGAGIGETLSREIIARACSEGAQTLDLLVFNDNVPAIRMYRKLGFEMHTIAELESRLVREENPSGRRRVLMRKRLER